LIFKLTSLGNV